MSVIVLGATRARDDSLADEPLVVKLLIRPVFSQGEQSVIHALAQRTAGRKDDPIVFLSEQRADHLHPPLALVGCIILQYGRVKHDSFDLPVGQRLVGIVNARHLDDLRVDVALICLLRVRSGPK